MNCIAADKFSHTCGRPGDASLLVENQGLVVHLGRRHAIAEGRRVAYIGGMSEVTRILSAIDKGDPHAAEQLLPLVYDELRKLAAQRLAQEKPGQTLQATALVHEAYLRLVDVNKAQEWNSRGHFFSAAAEAMRRILLNRARDKKRQKRGGGWQRLDLDALAVADNASDDELIALDDALLRLAQENPACAKLVQLRFFTGMTLAEAATALGLARRSADRQWAYARAWLYEALKHDNPSAPDSLVK